MTNLKNYSILLLSAGIGRRLGKLGINTPKCLLKIKEKRIIEYLIEHLQKRKVKEISIVVGYKSKMIIDALKRFKKIKFNFIKINNYKKNGHAVSWHSYKNMWEKKKNPILLFHTDIFFDPAYIDNIVKSKKDNIIGIHSNNKDYKKKSVLVYTDDYSLITKIGFREKKIKAKGEVLGINKISKKTSKNLFSFMDKFLTKKNKKLNWEFMLNEYIKINRNNESFFSLSSQNFFWTNLNFKKDFLRVNHL